MCDLDHFKVINDTYGHHIGDMMLCEVAKAIASHCRESDFPARYGGEEFSIIAPEQDIEGAAHLAERCREAIEEIESHPEYLNTNSIVVSSRGWHPGVIGIVASRIVERYGKPAVLVAVGEDGIGKGSGRSVTGINIYRALTQCSELLLQYGGHEQAAGISIREGNIDKFRKMLEVAIGNQDELLESVLKIDCRVELESISEELISEFETLEPFGIGNPEPVLLAKSVEVLSERLLKDKHLRLKVKQGDKPFDAIWFNMKEPRLLKQNEIDIVFTPEFNKWNGKKELRLRVRDID